MVAAIKTDPKSAVVSDGDRAMLDYAAKLTRAPRSIGAEDIEALRTAGFSDVAIHDIAQVVSLFNYYNRLADGLGIEPESHR